ncbi:MAG TPA: chromosome segregation protein SMC, partial [Myxococcaceae bacterium]|nr:chromosome segregation protein SMC [Myxococcaceae bacterium]
MEDLVAQTRALLRKQDEAVWRAWTEGAPVDLHATADEEAALYTREAIARIDQELARAGDPLDRRALEALRTHFAGELLARTVAKETHALATAEASLAFRNGGEQHALRDLNRVLARERNALTRQETYASAAKLAQGLSPLIQARQQRIAQAVSELGYSTPKEFAAILRRADLDALSREAARILEITEPSFRSVLQQLAARELRLPFERVR